MSSTRIALSFAPLLCVGGLRAQEIGGPTLEECRALILPRPEECSWEAIPWRPGDPGA